MVDGMLGDSEMRMDQRWRVAIYGDILSSEHAKARVLIQIDTLVRIPTVHELLHTVYSNITVTLAWPDGGWREN